jgi:hypothetical protein
MLCATMRGGASALQPFAYWALSVLWDGSHACVTPVVCVSVHKLRTGPEVLIFGSTVRLRASALLSFASRAFYFYSGGSHACVRASCLVRLRSGLMSGCRCLVTPPGRRSKHMSARSRQELFLSSGVGCARACFLSCVRLH